MTWNIVPSLLYNTVLQQCGNKTGLSDRVYNTARLDTQATNNTDTRSCYITYTIHDKEKRTELNFRQYFISHNYKQSPSVRLEWKSIRAKEIIYLIVIISSAYLYTLSAQSHLSSLAHITNCPIQSQPLGALVGYPEAHTWYAL